MRGRGPAGRESGGVERHAPVQLGWALVCREHQMRSGVRITSDQGLFHAHGFRRSASGAGQQTVMGEDRCKIALTFKGYLHRPQRGLQSRTFMVQMRQTKPAASNHALRKTPLDGA